MQCTDVAPRGGGVGVGVVGVVVVVVVDTTNTTASHVVRHMYLNRHET